VLPLRANLGVFLMLMAVFTVDTESSKDSSSACGHLHFGEGGLVESDSQYSSMSLFSSAIANIMSLWFLTHASFGHQDASSAQCQAAGLNNFFKANALGPGLLCACCHSK